MPHRYELSGAERERIAPLLPPLEMKGTSYEDHRLTLNGFRSASIPAAALARFTRMLWPPGRPWYSASDAGRMRVVEIEPRGDLA